MSARLRRYQRAPGVIDVWTLDLDIPQEQIPADEALLDDAERDRAGRFRSPDDRRRFIARRAALRRVLAQYTDDEPVSLRFIANAFGKPALAGETDCDGLRFNASHSGDLAVVVVTRGRDVGVDIERHRMIDEMAGIARSHFTPAEREALEASAPDERARVFFDLWTRKEALVKAIGTGLSHPLNRIAVSTGPGPLEMLLTLAADNNDPRRWTLAAAGIDTRWSFAVVHEGEPGPRRWFDARGKTIPRRSTS